MQSVFFLALLFSHAEARDIVQHEMSEIATALDLPRPFLSKEDYMTCVYKQAVRQGASELELSQLHWIAHVQTRENPRLCVPNGCGPFQHEVHTLVPEKLIKVPQAHALVRFLLTNQPGYSVRTTLDLVRRCKKLAREHWACCYDGAYFPDCRVKWDSKYRRDRFFGNET